MDCLQRAIALQPNYAKAYFGIGLILDQKGELEGAIGQYRQAIALEPDYKLPMAKSGNFFSLLCCCFR